MRETVPDIAVVLGEYILDTGDTVRAVALGDSINVINAGFGIKSIIYG